MSLFSHCLCLLLSPICKTILYYILKLPLHRSSSLGSRWCNGDRSAKVLSEGTLVKEQRPPQDWKQNHQTTMKTCPCLAQATVGELQSKYCSIRKSHVGGGNGQTFYKHLAQTLAAITLEKQIFNYPCLRSLEMPETE